MCPGSGVTLIIPYFDQGCYGSECTSEMDKAGVEESISAQIIASFVDPEAVCELLLYAIYPPTAAPNDTVATDPPTTAPNETYATDPPTMAPTTPKATLSPTPDDDISNAAPQLAVLSVASSVVIGAVMFLF